MQRCLACPGPDCTQVCYIPPDGDDTDILPILFIGAGPGKTEARTLRIYSGKAGEELEQTYLPLARLRRENVHITNASLCYAGDDRIPPENRVRVCAQTHLPRLFDQIKPELIVIMGGVTCRIVDESDTCPRLRLDMHRGRPFWGSILNHTWEGWIWSSFEPALGMRDTGQMTGLLDDFTHLGEWRSGEWAPPTPPENVKKDYRLITDPVQLREYLKIDGLKRPWLPTRIAIDTERHGTEPWSVQFSTSKHSGRMIRAVGMVEECLLEEFGWWLNETKAEVILHNAGQDIDEMEKMHLPAPDSLDRLGITVPTGFRDTMQEAFQLCHLPQGLKALVYRLFGSSMTSWEDTVWPASVDAVMQWMGDAIMLAEGQLQDCEVTETATKICQDCGKKGRGRVMPGASIGTVGSVICVGCASPNMQPVKKTTYKPAVVGNILQHIVRYTSNNTEDQDKPYDPWKALLKMKAGGLRGKKAEEWEWEYLEAELGPMPILGIGNCELNQAVQYGCSDSDMTLQVADALEAGRKDKRWVIDKEDWDV